MVDTIPLTGVAAASSPTKLSFHRQEESLIIRPFMDIVMAPTAMTKTHIVVRPFVAGKAATAYTIRLPIETIIKLLIS